MATKTVLIDDIDGGEADVTIAFVINGESYSVDLSHKNEKAFYKAIDPYIQAASSGSKVRLASIEAEKIGVEQRAAIREWAKKNGHMISERGRLPQDVIDAYNGRRK